MTPADTRILVVDDEDSVLTYLRDVLQDEGYSVITTPSGNEARDLAEKHLVHLAIVDLVMPDLSGIEVLKHIRARLPDTRVIIITANATVESAIEAMKLGALEYMIKPFSLDEFKMHVARALEEVKLAREVRVLKHEATRTGPGSEIVGKSPQIGKVLSLIRDVADESSTILIKGETGTGKELVARALHRQSARRETPFLAVNCGAMAEALLERELFGNERGAYTGADAARPGLLEAAGDGVIFFDEIGEMALALQVKLLRVLEGHEFLRVGGTRPIRSHARFICATNQNLDRAVAEKRFRPDLFYRLNVVAIEIAPLRERREDIAVLAGHFLKLFATEKRRAISGFTKAAEKLLHRYDWPGNVRELKNVIERAVILSDKAKLDASDLRLGGETSDDEGRLKSWLSLPFKDAKRKFEKTYLEHALHACRSNVSQTAARTGLDRKNLQGKLKRHKLK